MPLPPQNKIAYLRNQQDALDSETIKEISVNKRVVDQKKLANKVEYNFKKSIELGNDWSGCLVGDDTFASFDTQWKTFSKTFANVSANLLFSLKTITIFSNIKESLIVDGFTTRHNSTTIYEVEELDSGNNITVHNLGYLLNQNLTSVKEGKTLCTLFPNYHYH